MQENNFSFHQVSNQDTLAHLRHEYIQSLHSPPDGMWEAFRSQATNWEIRSLGKPIGYFGLDGEDQMIQFYLSPEHISHGLTIFQLAIEHSKPKNIIVGTHHPVFLSLALHFAKGIDVHSYLFRQIIETESLQKEGDLHLCQPHDLNKIVDFCHASIGAPKEWLEGYISGLIQNEEVFYLEKDTKIVGTCEVRASVSTPDFMDIGMIVSPDFRKQGYGTFLLQKAKEIALSRNKTPICSCEKDNIGSLKSIHNCGFVSTHRLITINLT